MSDSRGPEPSDLPVELAEQVIEQYLSAAPAERPAVRAALLRAHPEHADALQRMFADLAGTEQLLDSSFPDDEPRAPHSIGGCRVLRCLGEGAFGVVHLCEQERPVKRLVAIKVLRPGAGDRQTLRRFEAERQLLASLNHGSITQIFDAGHLPDGRPFFVMEFVDGLPITTYVERHELDCAARLQLFVDLCLGIEHAHARGIVHRDLKPANVLVVDAIPAPQPKIIDFGIAKALDAPRAGEPGGPGSTDPGRVIGTPGYMSPEQAGGQADEVDARADVFALGVMLYELMTGELPWERGESATDRDPELPSARVTTRNRPATATTQTSPRRLAALLRGDLDWITLKALSRERERRYQTVRELIDDIERHRDGRPVLAGRPSTGYRIAKFVRRNRTAVMSLGSAFVAVAIGLTLSLSFAARAGEAQARARNEAAASFDDATAAVEQLLARASDERIRRLPQSDAVRQEMLQDALTFYDRWLGERPAEPHLRAQRCKALSMLSLIHWHLGRMPEAERIANEACSLAAELQNASPDDVEVRALLADAQRKQGMAIASNGRSKAALPLFVEATRNLEICFRAAPAVHGLAFSSALRELASTEQALRQMDEALQSYRDSLRVLEQMLPTAPADSTVHSDAVIAAGGLAQQLILVQKLDEAEAELLRAAGRLPSVSTERHRATSMIENLLGDIALRRGDPSAAIPRFDAAMQAAARWREEEPQRLMPQVSRFQSARRLGTAHERLQQWDEADAAYRTAVEISDAMVEQFPEDPTRRASLASTLAEQSRLLWDRFRARDLEQADAWARRALALRAEISDAMEIRRSGVTWQYQLMVARIGESMGRPTADLWEDIATELGRHEDAGEGFQPQARLEPWVEIARSRIARGLLDEAEAALAEPRAALASGQPLAGQWVIECARAEAELAIARGDHATAAAMADRMLAPKTVWSGKWRAAETLCGAWRCANAQVDLDPSISDSYRDRAAGLLREVIAALADDVKDSPDDAWYVVPFGFSSLWLAQIEADRGDPGAARGLLATAMPALRRVEPTAHRDQWNDATWRAASALEQSLAAGSSR